MAGFRGAIFDVDGVLVDSPHEQAWREASRQLMENERSGIRDQTSYAPERFTPEVYQRLMSGRRGRPRRGGPGPRRTPCGQDSSGRHLRSRWRNVPLGDCERRFIRFHPGTDVERALAKLAGMVS